MAHILDRLFDTIASRRGADPAKSYTAQLLGQGAERCAKKFGEEAVEAVIAAVKGDQAEITAESADVLYHLLVLWAHRELPPADVWAALARREGLSGVEEKRQRKE